MPSRFRAPLHRHQSQKILSNSQTWLCPSLTLNPSIAPPAPSQSPCLGFCTFQIFLHHLQLLSVPSPGRDALVLLCLAGLCYWDPSPPPPPREHPEGPLLRASPACPTPIGPLTERVQRGACRRKGLASVLVHLSFPPTVGCPLGAGPSCRDWWRVAGEGLGRQGPFSAVFINFGL